MQLKQKEGFNRIALLSVDHCPATDEFNVYIDFLIDELKKSDIKMKADFFDAVSDRLHEMADLVQRLGMLPDSTDKNKFVACDLYRISELQHHNIYTWDLEGWNKFKKWNDFKKEGN